ncbi:hypothetical protein ABT213_31685 [Streptomyces sp. NPDC001674]|uniref:hypothetical protein n=1 Tax=Streptomyces sp. NPDC001674 TaxID=3154394 RepID=UPI003327A4C0
MRTVRTLPAIALASTLALAGAATTTTAFAATPAPAPAAVRASLRVPSSPVKPGDAVSVTVTAPAGSRNLTVSSSALRPLTLRPAQDSNATWTGTATVATVKDGGYAVTLTASGPDGAPLQARARLTVQTTAATSAPTPRS